VAPESVLACVDAGRAIPTLRGVAAEAPRAVR